MFDTMIGPVPATPHSVHSGYAGLVAESAVDFRVHTSIYTDATIFEDELERIFETSWVYVAHDSEVPAPGDYRTAVIGRQPVIVSRDQQGAIHLLLNTCRHRGNVVCREERGNASVFRCPYHGWLYGSSGELLGVSERGGYSEGFEQRLGGLVPVPRMAVYRGLIFGSLSPTGESLEDYLGEAREYVDLWVERSPNGVVRVRRPHKYVYPANWKFQAEQDSDGYHGRYVHESAFKTTSQFQGQAREERRTSVHGIGATRGFRNGHCLLERPGTRGELPAELLEEYLEALAGRYGPQRAERIAMVRHVFLFPNVYLMDDHLRVHYPIQVDRTEVHSFFTFLEGAPAEVNRLRLKNLQWRHSQAGLIGTDDVEMFIGCQSGMQARAAGWITLARGLESETQTDSGERLGGSSDETPQRAIYRHWVHLMTQGPVMGQRG